MTRGLLGRALLAATLLASVDASAELLPHGDAAQGRVLAQQVCAACHGAKGNSVDAQYPNLAGQNARYLYDQLLAFKAQGHRRASGVMGAIAVDLSDAQMRDAAAYFAAQRPSDAAPARPPVDDRLLARGASIYRQGLSRDPAVPACASCHALSGNGLPPEFPRLAGQHARYVEKQLAEFRSERRNSNPNQMMSEVAHKLTDRDMRAVASYIATLQ